MPGHDGPPPFVHDHDLSMTRVMTVLTLTPGTLIFIEQSVDESSKIVTLQLATDVYGNACEGFVSKS
jgi:hypothetical protein